DSERLPGVMFAVHCSFWLTWIVVPAGQPPAGAVIVTVVADVAVSVAPGQPATMATSRVPLGSSRMVAGPVSVRVRTAPPGIAPIDAPWSALMKRSQLSTPRLTRAG